MTHQSSGIPIAISPVNVADTLHVDVKLFGNTCSFLVDTGAAVSLISLDVWKQLSAPVTLEPLVKQRLVSVSGSPLEVAGSARVTIVIGGTGFEVTVIVVDGVAAEGILGLDFLQLHQCSIDIDKRLLYLQNASIQVQLDSRKPRGGSTGATGPITAVVAETTIVPARSELEVLATAKGAANVGQSTWLLEHSLPEQSKVVVARSIVSLEESDGQTTQVVVRLINPSNEIVTLRKDTKVASLQMISDSDVQVLSAVDKPCLNDISQQKRNMLWDVVQRTDGLSESEKDSLFMLLMTYEDVFATDSTDMGHTTVIKHTIDTGAAPPVHLQPRRLPPHYREQAHHLVEKMLQKDVIQRSTSPWSSPIVLVTKKDGSLRFCVDYRKVNSLTRRDAYPLPRVDDTLATLAGSKWFTTLDLLSGYWQVELDEADREKTAFATREGLFEFKVMPFGLTNAPATFQRLMDMVLAGLQWSHCLVYLDDIVILGRDFQEHLSNIRCVFQRLRSAGLKVKPSKCELLKKRVYFLGHVISEEGIATDPAKTEKVASWPVPTSRREVQQFLGLANYYRRFVKNFAIIAKPLHRLTEKNSSFKWSEDCQQAFELIRRKLVSPPILAFPDYSKEFILDTDASDTGVGAVLSQVHDDGSEHVVAYASRVLTKAERKYSVTRKELLAVVVFIDHFRQYLLGQSFLLRTDHSSLAWLKNFRNPEGQLARWLERLGEYSFTIQHRPGRKHLNADALSRLPEHQEEVINPINAVDETSAMFREKTWEELRVLQLEDPHLRLVLEAKENDKRPTKDQVSGESLKTRKLVQIWDQLSVSNGVLMRDFYDERRNISFKQFVVPSCLQSEVLDDLHAGTTSGHLGEEKTLNRLKQRFYWPGHYRDVQDWCKRCSTCMTRKTSAPKNRAPLTSMRVGNPGQILSVDIVGPFPENCNGHKYILVAVDHFTKWSEAYGIPNQEASTVAQILTQEWFCRYSPPESLHSDQGRQFESRLIQEICRILQIKKTRTSPYHPQCDGVAERFNRTLLNMLATATKDNPLNWEDYIRPLCMAYNTSVHSSTGFTPFYLTFGREARLPIDLKFGTGDQETLSPNDHARKIQKALSYAYNIVRGTLGNVQQRQKTLYDKKIHGKPYNVGDRVWLFSTVIPNDGHRKLHHPWTGPYIIIEKLSDANYKIRRVGVRDKTLVVHFDRLKICLPGTRFPSPLEDTLAAGSSRNVGDGAELVDGDEPETNGGDSDEGVEPPVPSRYPQRHRREPDRLHPFVRH